MRRFTLKYGKYFLLLGLLYTPLFSQLGKLPLRIWDEARLANNAYEMYSNGDYIVTHYDGAPEMWNTKPPLLIWVQVGFMHFFGVNEVSLRLPSAIAALLTCLLLVFFSLRYFQSFWLGFIAALVLVTSHGYVNMHGARSADYDVPLTLLTTLGCLGLFSWCHNGKNSRLYLFFVCLALAVLTKSITGMLFLPGMAIYVISQRKLAIILKNKHFYVGAVSFLAIVGGYYLLRETQNPGYMEAVSFNELGRRYFDVVEDHKAGYWFYFDNIVDIHLSYWHLLIPSGFLIGFFSKDFKIRNFSIFSFILVSTFFLVISFGKTKIAWYDMPMFPFLALTTAIFLHFIYYWLRDIQFFNTQLSVNIFPFIFLFFVFIFPYKSIISTTYKPKETGFGGDQDFYAMGYYLRDALKGKYDLNHRLALYDGSDYYAHNLFYLNLLKNQGVDVSFGDWTNLNPGDTVFVSEPHLMQYIEDHYTQTILGRKSQIATYAINGQKYN